MGSLIVLITNPRDLPALVKELGRWKWSVMTGVNTLFNGLLNTPGFGGLDFSALKVVIGGGAAVQKPVAERWQQVTGRYITEAYGLTETSPGACCVPLNAPWNVSIGLPIPSTDMSIRDDGFNVYPNEIESVVATHPGVLECGVVGVPDDKSGEAVKAVIVRKDPNLTKEAVILHCKTQLTGYKPEPEVNRPAASDAAAADHQGVEACCRSTLPQHAEIRPEDPAPDLDQVPATPHLGK